MNINKLIGGFKFKACKALVLKERIGKTDLGILKVAFMIAALDGDVTEAEYEAFDALAKKCRGYTPDGAAEALKSAMHSAGYLMLLSKRVKTAELVKAFIAEAKEALPDGFAYFSIEDVRRAIVTWIAVGLSDGDYSARERACVEALRKLFAELKVKQIKDDEERWAALSPAFRQAYGSHSDQKRVALVEKDFVTQVENLMAQYGDSATAAKELRELIDA